MSDILHGFLLLPNYAIAAITLFAVSAGAVGLLGLIFIADKIEIRIPTGM